MRRRTAASFREGDGLDGDVHRGHEVPLVEDRGCRAGSAATRVFEFVIALSDDRRGSDRAVPPHRRALSCARRARGRGARAHSRHADARAGSRPRAGTVRCACAARRRLRLFAARPARELALGRRAGDRRGGADHRRRRARRALAGSGHVVGGRDRARRDRAPPDAAAATAVLKQLHPRTACSSILEGESLFNDASALLIYRLAIGAALAGALPAGASSRCCRRDAGQRRARARPGARHLPLYARISDVHRGGRSVLRRRSGSGCLPSPCTSPVFSRWWCSRWRRAPRRRRHPGAPADPVVRGVGVRRVRAQRARVHPGRLPAQGDPRALDTPTLVGTRRRRGRVRRDDLVAHRLGDGAAASPLALRARGDGAPRTR